MQPQSLFFPSTEGIQPADCCHRQEWLQASQAEGISAGKGITSARELSAVEEGGQGVAGGAIRGGAHGLQRMHALAGALHDVAGPIAIRILPTSRPHLLHVTPAPGLCTVSTQPHSSCLFRMQAAEATLISHHMDFLSSLPLV